MKCRATFYENQNVPSSHLSCLEYFLIVLLWKIPSHSDHVVRALNALCCRNQRVGELHRKASVCMANRMEHEERMRRISLDEWAEVEHDINSLFVTIRSKLLCFQRSIFYKIKCDCKHKAPEHGIQRSHCISLNEHEIHELGLF